MQAGGKEMDRAKIKEILESIESGALTVDQAWISCAICLTKNWALPK